MAGGSSPKFSHTPPSRHPRPVGTPAGSGADATSSTSSSSRGNFALRYLFPFILLTQVCIYMEAGSVPALLNELGDAFNMSFSQLGLIGAVGYLCLSVGCPVSTWAFRRFDAPAVLGSAILLNALATAVFACTPARASWVPLLIVSRGIIGATQSASIIFFPLWCDAHAPPDRKTTWLSYVQGGVVAGILLGYACATVTFLFPSCGLVECWRVPFVLQTLFTAPLAALAFAIPAEHCNIRGADGITEEGGGEAGDEEAGALVAGDEHRHHLHGGAAAAVAATAATPLLIKGRHASHSNASLSSPSGSLSDTHVDEDASSSVEAGSNLVASVNSILGPLAVLPSDLPEHLEGQQPRSNPSPWPTPRRRGGASDDEEEDEEELDAEATQRDAGYGYGSVAAIDDAASGAPSSSLLAMPVPERRFSHQVSTSSGAALVWHKTTTREGLAILLSNKVYLYVVLSLSAGYFAIISISFWGTNYFISILNAPASAVRAGFMACALTAPVGGVLFGGVVVDRAGGYSGLHQRTEALQRCVVFLLVGAVAAALTCIFGGGDGDGTFHPVKVLVLGGLLWTVLFFGSAALPPAMGVLLNCIHPDMRPFAASVATIAYNVLGYTGGPLLSGQVMTATGEFMQGFRVVLYAAGPCLLLMALAWNESRAQRKARRREMQRRAEHDAAVAEHRKAAAAAHGAAPNGKPTASAAAR